MTPENRTRELVGAVIVDVLIAGEIAYFEVEHRGSDDEAARLEIPLDMIVWRYPRPDAEQENA